MENIFLVKIQTNVNQRKHVHNSFLLEVSHTIKIQNFDHQNWSDFFLYKNLFFFATLNWVFKCHISACRFLYAGFYCVALTDLRGDFVRVSLVSGAKFVC